jgi:PKD repeat protein
MAAPQVAGLATLLYAVGVADTDGNGRVNDEVREFIRSTCDDVDAAGWDEYTGWGRVNIYQAVLAATGGTGNIPPVAAFSYTADKLACTFDATASYDADGEIVSYAWDFGDGDTATGIIVNHDFPADDTYTVTLTVTDDEDAVDDVAQDVTVTSGNLQPIASFTWSAEDLTCSFDASGSYDPDGSITTYAWDFGDGEYGSGVTCEHTYAEGGAYSVTLTVTDNEDATGTDSQEVFVGTGGEDTMHIAAIETWYRTFGPNFQNYFEFTVRDDDNQEVAGATVICDVELPDGSVQTLQEVTGNDGTCYVRVWSSLEGVYTVTVTDVTHTVLVYDPAANVVTSQEHVVP